MKRIAIVTGASSGMGQELIRQITGRNDIDEIWAIARRADKIIKYSLELAMDYQVEASKVVAMPLDLLNKEHRVSLKTALEKDKPD
ncbi:MAG: short-chain dehydrogenase, partial [Lachnospiraceae bacterium]|nr:short-chain dehydrogenase [Lachnospiraceae bacterium]